MTTFWQGDLATTIAVAGRVSDPATRSPHLSAWLGGCAANAPVSSNVGWGELPFQRWMKFKEAFSPKFVVDALASMPRPVRRCADPFGGSGTTALTCAFLGIEAVTIEVNPFLADLIDAKLNPPSAFELAGDFSGVLAEARSGDFDIEVLRRRLPSTFIEPIRSVEPGAVLRFVYWREALDRILTLRMAVERCANERSRRLLRILLGSTLVEASNVLVNGKGRRYRKGWERRRVGSGDVDRLFGDAVRRAARDLGAFGAQSLAPATILRGDSRLLAAELGPIDAAILSPPYPNSFDYTDVYNLELWTLGYLDDAAANRRLRLATLRSHVQVHFEDPTLRPSGRLEETFDRLVQARSHLWDPRLPEMVLGYFQDMDCVLQALHRQLSEGGRVVMVVGDSRYAGIHVDVAAILRERAEASGFAMISATPIRSMRSSAQHGGAHELPETCIVLERD
ncbi:hypothetical protein D8770_27155 [Methylobacterium sp. DB1607]|nr:hypothetical protein [Methylobacterium sp. DB1607]